MAGLESIGITAALVSSARDDAYQLVYVLIVCPMIFGLGFLLAWIGSFFMYGYGELIEKTCQNEENTGLILSILLEGENTQTDRQSDSQATVPPQPKTQAAVPTQPKTQAAVPTQPKPQAAVPTQPDIVLPKEIQIQTPSSPRQPEFPKQAPVASDSEAQSLAHPDSSQTSTGQSESRGIFSDLLKRIEQHKNEQS